jgi:hypothetical protein
MTCKQITPEQKARIDKSRAEELKAMLWSLRGIWEREITCLNYPYGWTNDNGRNSSEIGTIIQPL